MSASVRGVLRTVNWRERFTLKKQTPQEAQEEEGEEGSFAFCFWVLLVL